MRKEEARHFREPALLNAVNAKLKLTEKKLLLLLVSINSTEK